MNEGHFVVADELGYLAHGIQWKHHRYIRKEGNRYIYPEDLKKCNNSSNSTQSNPKSKNSYEKVDFYKKGQDTTFGRYASQRGWTNHYANRMNEEANKALDGMHKGAEKNDRDAYDKALNEHGNATNDYFDKYSNSLGKVTDLIEELGDEYESKKKGDAYWSNWDKKTNVKKKNTSGKKDFNISSRDNKGYVTSDAPYGSVENNLVRDINESNYNRIRKSFSYQAEHNTIKGRIKHAISSIGNIKLSSLFKKK